MRRRWCWLVEWKGPWLDSLSHARIVIKTTFIRPFSPKISKMKHLDTFYKISVSYYNIVAGIKKKKRKWIQWKSRIFRPFRMILSFPLSLCVLVFLHSLWRIRPHFRYACVQMRVECLICIYLVFVGFIFPTLYLRRNSTGFQFTLHSFNTQIHLYCCRYICSEMDRMFDSFGLYGTHWLIFLVSFFLTLAICSIFHTLSLFLSLGLSFFSLSPLFYSLSSSLSFSHSLSLFRVLSPSFALSRSLSLFFTHFRPLSPFPLFFALFLKLSQKPKNI